MADAKVLLGKPVARDINETSRERAEAPTNKLGRALKLVVLSVNDPAGASYLKSISSAAKQVGVEMVSHQIGNEASTESYVEGLFGLNRDSSVDGILVQTPLPPKVSLTRVARAINPEKDVDGISPTQAGYLFQGLKSALLPSTARAAIEILDYNNYGLQGLEVVIIGRSLVVGRPFGLMALSRNATVTWCHSKTHGIKSVCKRAEILVVAIGKPRMVDQTYVRPGATVIDVGINVDDDGKLCGDVDSDSIQSIAAAYTPVPGGVGPVTSACLIANLVDAVKRRTET